MSTTAITVPARPVSRSMTAAYATATTITFMAVSAAPTPIYRFYRETLGLTPFTITFIFAIYSFTMIAAFLTIARLSDYVGRKPMVLLALALNAVALLLFFVAESAGALIAARAVQGVATGVALATLGAVIVDTAPGWAPVLNSVTAFLGLALGALISGVFVAFAPWPTHLVYAVLLGVTLVEIVILAWVAETVSRKAGAWSGIRPKLTVPAAAVAPMARLFPLTLSAWALGGFYLSLMPSLIIEATGIRSPLVGAAVVSALMVSGGLASFVTRTLDAGKTVRASAALLAVGIVITMAAIAGGSPAGMFFGTIVAGLGFGASYGASLRVLLPLASAHQRAGLLSAYFVESYLAFALAAIAAGVAAPRFGLVTTALVYGSILALSALVTLAVETAAARR
ncbi:MAG: MFS transporter [Hyphomicrobiales bacterium]|nr:MFS transporter [Hyphomicrobiales bacterium]